MSERIAVYTTWYPGIERFLEPWHASLRAQTDQAFDLWIGADGVDAPRLLAALPADDRPVHFYARPGATPAQVREGAIRQILDAYPSVVFVDSDDWLEASRVAAAREGLRRHDVVGCALRIVDEDGRDAGVRFAPPPDAPWEQLLPRYNVFGLSNSAYRTEVLRRCLPVPNDCILFDWLLVTRAWALGASLDFDATVRMAYRQYPGNVARVLPPFGTDEVLAASARVLDYYGSILSDEGWRLPTAPRQSLEAARDYASDFLAAVRGSRPRLDAYVAALNRLPPRFMWWWLVANPELENTWTH
jgi:hypothetical protein